MKKELVKIEIVKRGKEWKIDFSIGVQSFTLEYGGTKAEAVWMARMLKLAFSKIT